MAQLTPTSAAPPIGGADATRPAKILEDMRALTEFECRELVAGLLEIIDPEAVANVLLTCSAVSAEIAVSVASVKVGEVSAHIYDLVSGDTPEMPVGEGAALQQRVRTLRDLVKSTNTMLSDMFDRVSIVLVPNLMERTGFSNVVIKGLGRVELRADVNIHVPAASRGGLFDWLKEQGAEDLITPGLNSSTFKAFWKERNKNGDELPTPDMVRVTPYTRAVIVKA